VKHTPGPWRAGKNLYGELLIHSENKKLETLVLCVLKDAETNEELFANRALIAAAPELLKALERCVAALRANGAPNCQAAKEAHAVIAKATDSDGVF
jgi:hypothetical protein